MLAAKNARHALFFGRVATSSRPGPARQVATRSFCRTASFTSTSRQSPLSIFRNLQQGRNLRSDVGGSARRSFQSQASTDTKARFFYKMTAAFSAKGTPFEKGSNYCQFDSETGQQRFAGRAIESADARRKRHASGQDAFFMAGVGDGGSAAFGVADGVGGWADQGIDSAAFAHGLCDELHSEASDFSGAKPTTAGQLHPGALLQASYHNVCHNARIVGGGSTACVAVADAHGVMRVANLGDSGFLQLRSNAVLGYSEPQTHAFNTPFQLSQVPPKVLKQISKFGGRHPLQDMPADADITTHNVRHGDVFVFGTDGVWDNLSPEDILTAVTPLMKSSGAWVAGEDGAVAANPKLMSLVDESRLSTVRQATLQTELAQLLAGKAKAASLDRNRDGPFAKALHKAYPREYWSGGKADDICLIVVVVLEEQS